MQNSIQIDIPQPAVDANRNMVFEEQIAVPSESSVEDKFFSLLENNGMQSQNVHRHDAKKYFFSLLEEYTQSKTSNIPSPVDTVQVSDQMKLKLHQTEKNCHVLKKGMLAYNKKFETLKSKNEFIERENQMLKTENIRLRIEQIGESYSNSNNQYGSGFNGGNAGIC